MNNSVRKRAGQNGFTLIELLIVVIILGLLAAIVGPKMFGQVGKAKTKSAKAQISNFETALDLYRLDVGHYPTSDEGLEALRTKPEAETWQGPYIEKQIPKDPWGNDYQYRSPGEHGEFDLYSYGADGVEGGEGENQDVTSWE